MVITQEEKRMYDVMKAIYKSGIPISFKGSMVLKICLVEAGYLEETRHTVDIDGNWNSNLMPTANQMVDSLQKAMDKSELNLIVKLNRMYSEKQSAGFVLIDSNTGEKLFTMDIDVNRPNLNTKLYEIEGIKFIGYSPVQILADKLVVLSTDIIFRRVKDFVDIYYLSYIFDFNKEEILETIDASKRILGDFNAYLNRKEELKNAYDKFRFNGLNHKPTFDEVYKRVKNYINEILLIDR